MILLVIYVLIKPQNKYISVRLEIAQQRFAAIL
jgi:hypothetical protein